MVCVFVRYVDISIAFIIFIALNCIPAFHSSLFVFDVWCLMFELLRTINNVFFIVFRCRRLALGTRYCCHYCNCSQTNINIFNIMPSIKQLNGVEFIKQMSKENPCVQIVVPFRFRFLFRLIRHSSEGLSRTERKRKYNGDKLHFHCSRDCAILNAKRLKQWK